MKDRVVLVTGGASGIGKGIVHMFAKKGCQVIIFDVQDEKGETLAKELNDKGNKVVYKHVNLFNVDEIQAAYTWIKDQYGKLDYAINNAGFGIPAKPLDEVTSEEVNKVIGICLIAVANCMIEEVKMMKAAGFGRIVNTASGAGLFGGKGNSIYCAAKHGVVGITKAAALDYAMYNMTINAVAPGAIETELVSSLKEIAPDAYKQAEESNPAGRLGKPEDIANAVIFLCEDSSSFINGVVIPVDSGYCAGK